MQTFDQNGLSISTTKAGLTAGTTTTYTTANTVQFCIFGKAYSKAAVTNGATPVLDGTTAAAFKTVSANQGSVYLFAFDKTGALVVSQGDVKALDTSGAFVDAPQFPELPDTAAPFGYLVAKAGSTAVGTWTFGTNNLSSVTGLTYTFVDVMSIPYRPQIL